MFLENPLSNLWHILNGKNQSNSKTIQDTTPALSMNTNLIHELNLRFDCDIINLIRFYKSPDRGENCASN